MSHNKRNYAVKSNRFEGMFYTGLLLCIAAFFSLFTVFAMQAHAAETVTTKSTQNPSYVLKAGLDDLSNTDKAVLDWRTNTYTLNFDLPAHDWYDEFDLFISAYPEGNVSNTAPLTIAYNGTDPIFLNGQGQSFEAQISLRTSRIRTAGNKIEISFPPQDNATCLGQNDGRWVIDLSRSKLVARARAKNRNMQVREIEPRLIHPMTAPKRVAIIAMGTRKPALEALAAQGIALRMEDVPQYQFNLAASDFQIIIGTHTQITPYVKKSDWMPRDSAQAFITKGKQARLVLTAPTDEQLLELTRVFSAYHLPNTSRRSVSKSEFFTYPKFAPRPIVSAQTYSLPKIGNPVFNPSWSPEPAQLAFNVDDPLASYGSLTLNIISSKDIDKQSRVRVRLNDQSIGYTLLDKSKKTVAFDIKPGQFQPTDNQITIEPVFEKNSDAMSCTRAAQAPIVHITSRSKLKIKNNHPAPMTDIRRFAASGAPFNTAGTTIVLTAKSQKDRASTLHFFGYAAQQFGPAWSDAHFTSKIPSGAQLEHNILIIGPNAVSDPALLSTAPIALKLALRGKAIDVPNTRIAGLERHASLDGDAAFKMAANQNRKRTKLRSGGIASIYPSPYAKGKFIGIISADKSAAYPMAMKSLSTPKYWNALQGSVTRWDKNSIVMAQTASPYTAKTAAPQSVNSTGNNNKPQQIAARVTPPAPLVLRGASAPQYQAAPQKKAKKQRSFSMPKLPSMTSLKIKSQATWNNTTHYVKGLFSDGLNTGTAQRVWRDLTKNRLAMMILLALSAFFLIGFASPKSAGGR